LNLGATFTDAPGGTAVWVFSGDPNYKIVEGAAAIVIEEAGPAAAKPPKHDQR
jgi:hypothetical protein